MIRRGNFRRWSWTHFSRPRRTIALHCLCPTVSTDGRFPPKPCGARPESVALPCAFQVRAGALVGRAELLEELFELLRVVRTLCHG